MAEREKCWFCDKLSSKQLLVQQGYKLPGGALQAPRYQPVCMRHFNLYDQGLPDWKGRSRQKQIKGQTAMGAQ